MSLNLFKRAPKSPESSKGSDDGFDRAAYERRRQQVRRAQRNHRERKANYVKALEQEVVNLRKQNQHNIREFEEEIQILHSHLLNCGQQPPTRQARIINPVAFDPNNPSSFTVSKPAGLGQGLNLQINPEMLGSGGSSVDPASPPSQFASLPTGPPSQGLSPQAGHSPQPGLSPPASGMSAGDAPFGETSVVCEQTLPQLIDKVHGINFVLALEHPCMGHPDETRREFGTHSHMATNNLLAFAPTDVSKAESWEVPGANIDRLLALSNSFELQGEITPAQAWYRLKQHPKFMVMKQGHLDQLKELLMRESKCYGFGAVIEEQIWNIAAEEIFAQYRS